MTRAFLCSWTIAVIVLALTPSLTKGWGCLLWIALGTYSTTLIFVCFTIYKYSVSSGSAKRWSYLRCLVTRRDNFTVYLYVTLSHIYGIVDSCKEGFFLWPLLSDYQHFGHYPSSCFFRSFCWLHLIRYRLKTETESSLRNALRGSVVVKAFMLQAGGREFRTRWGDFFFNLPNHSGLTRLWGSLSL
jgi:hypothetical protein